MTQLQETLINSASTSTVVGASVYKENIDTFVPTNELVTSYPDPPNVVVVVPTGSSFVARGPVYKRLLFGFLFTILDFALGCAGAIVFLLALFTALGFSKPLIAEVGGNLCSHFGVASVTLFFILLDDKFIFWIRKKNVPVPLFNFIYLAVCLLIFMPLFFAEYFAMVGLFQVDRSKNYLPSIWAITLREQCIFLSFSIANICFGGNIIPDLSGWRYTLVMHVISFFIWLLFIDKVLSQTLLWTIELPPFRNYEGYKVLGSMLQTMVMGGLSFMSIFRFIASEILSKMTPSKRMGYTLPLMVIYCMVQWLAMYWINTIAYPNASFYDKANGVWGNVSMSWIGFQVVGFRLSGPMWHGLCRVYDPFTNQLRHNKCGVVMYIFLSIIFGHLYTYFFYLFFHHVIWPYIWSGIFGMDFGDTNRLARLDYTFPFFLGTVYLAIYNNDVFYERGNWGCRRCRCEE